MKKVRKVESTLLPEGVIALLVSTDRSYDAFVLERPQAEKLLYQLHSNVDTLRGMTKPLRLRDRIRRIFD